MWINFIMFVMMWDGASRNKSAWDFEGLTNSTTSCIISIWIFHRHLKTWHIQGQIHLLSSLVFRILVGITQWSKLEVILGFLILSKSLHILPFNQLLHPISFISILCIKSIHSFPFFLAAVVSALVHPHFDFCDNLVSGLPAAVLSALSLQLT